MYIDRELYANKLRISNPFSYYLDGYYNTSCLRLCRLQARMKGGVASIMQNIHFKFGLIYDKLNNTTKYCQVRHSSFFFIRGNGCFYKNESLKILFILFVEIAVQIQFQQA